MSGFPDWDGCLLVLNYTYDAAGHLASMTSSHTNGVSASYTYDSLNRLSTVVDSRLSGNQTTTYQYDTANNVNQATYPNGVQYGFTYDELNRLTQIATQQTGYLYALDAVGNRKTATELSGRQVTWSYDGIYRLTNEAITGASGGKNGSVAYGLDPVGNRESENSSLSGVPSGSYGYNANDEVSTESYDQNGNTLATGGKTFAYNSQNQLVSMGSTVALVYDGDGNRVSKTVSGTGTTRYLVDDLNPTGYPQIVDELTSAAVTRTYTYGLQRISQDQVISNTWTPSFYGYDGGGNVRQLTNSARTVTDTYDYDAFGNKINSTGTTPNNFLYRGEELDTDLGLYYLARYYDSRTGTFCSADPLAGDPSDPQSWNRYPYGRNDPIDITDPSGKSWWSKLLIDVGIGVAMYFAGPEIASFFGPDASAAGYAAGDLPETLSYTPQLLTRGATAAITAGGDAAAGAGGGLAAGLGGAAAAQVAQSTDQSNPQQGRGPIAPALTPAQKDCLNQNIAQINKVSNLNVTANNLAHSPYMYNGGMDFDFSVPGASQSALAATRYPSSFFNALTGIGHSLHVPAPGGADPSTYGTTNGAFTFTTHMDTAYSTWHTPAGALTHWWVDVRDKGAHRKPCGGAR